MGLCSFSCLTEEYVRTLGFREKQTCSKLWLPFCVAIAPLISKENMPFSGTGNLSVFGGSQKGGFQKGGSGGCSPERKPERGYVRQNNPFTKPPFNLPMSLFCVDKRVVSKRVVSADVPPERKPERGYVRQNHPFTKPPFYLPVMFLWEILLFLQDLQHESVVSATRKLFQGIATTAMGQLNLQGGNVNPCIVRDVASGSPQFQQTALFVGTLSTQNSEILR